MTTYLLGVGVGVGRGSLNGETPYGGVLPLDLPCARYSEDIGEVGHCLVPMSFKDAQ